MKSKICGLFLSLITLFTLCSCGMQSHRYVPGSFKFTLITGADRYDNYLSTGFKVELEYDREVNIYYGIKGTFIDSQTEKYDFYYNGSYMYGMISNGSSTTELTIQKNIYLYDLIEHFDSKKTYKIDAIVLDSVNIVDVENGDSSKMYVYLLSGVGLIAAAGLVVGCFINNKKEENIIE